MSDPIERILFDVRPGQEWHMQHSERAVLHHILDAVRPDVSLEIGTYQCGSLRPIAAASRTVFTFDISPISRATMEQFPNVEFETGNSLELLPRVIDEINNADREIGFVLIDGSHEEDGVRADIDACLSYVPKRAPLVIVMHDSANLTVRRGIETAGWAKCPYVHALDLDFVPGMLYDRPDIYGEIWGGLAVAVLLPERRSGDMRVSALFGYSLSILDGASGTMMAALRAARHLEASRRGETSGDAGPRHASGLARLARFGRRLLGIGGSEPPDAANLSGG